MGRGEISMARVFASESNATHIAPVLAVWTTQLSRPPGGGSRSS